MGGADVVELLGHDVLREFGFVALTAEVGEVEVAQFGGHDLRGGFGGGNVGQMAMAAQDALLEAPGPARAILQHLHIVVGFQHQDVGGTDAVEDEFGGVAEVGGKPDVRGGRAQQISHGILGIVRNGKCFDGEVGEFEGVTGGEKSPVNFRFPSVGGLEGEIGFLAPLGFERPDGGVLGGAVAIDGDMKFVGDAEQPADMVGMFVRNENSRKVFGCAADGGEALPDLTRGESGVHQHAGFGGLNVGAVPGGTAAQDGEFYGHRMTLEGSGGTGKFFLRNLTPRRPRSPALNRFEVRLG